MMVTRKSNLTGKVHTISLDITMEQVNDYMSGTLLQDAFPNLSDAEREFYKTGITAQEWKAVFGDDE